MTYKFTINYQEVESKSSQVEVVADSLEEARRKAENLDIDEWLDTDSYDTEDLTKVQKVADKHCNNLCRVYNEAFHNTETPVEPFIILQEFKKALEAFFLDAQTTNLVTISHDE